MTSILTIKDLAGDIELGQQQMTAVRGGQGNQANGTSQGNVLAAFAPMSVANGSIFAGGPVNVQADSKLDQTASNDSYSENYKGAFALLGIAG